VVILLVNLVVAAYLLLVVAREHRARSQRAASRR
jgi:hypothetical protein